MGDRDVVFLKPGETLGRLDRALKVGAEQTGGAFAVRVADAMPVGRWIDEHIHHSEEEAWFVFGGVLMFRVASKSIEAPAGSFILVPRGTVHGFGNAGLAPAAYLQLFAPAGMEGYFEERLALAQAAVPASNADYAGLEPAIHAALAKKYHMEFA